MYRRRDQPLKQSDTVGILGNSEWNWAVVGYVTESTDILGNTRFIDGNGDGIVGWDMGAYEFNSFKPPRFVNPPQMTEAGWRLTVGGEPNKLTRIQRSSNLTDWIDLWQFSMPAEGIMRVTDYTMEPRQFMFYRAVVP